MAKLQIPYYTIRRNGRAFWEPRPHMRALGFYSVPCAKNRDGTIKPHEIIRARWSVSLRSNSRNLEDRQGYTGTSRGLVWGGECVKVIDSRIDGRLLAHHRSLSEALLRPRPVRCPAPELRQVGADESWSHSVHRDAVLAQL